MSTVSSSSGIAQMGDEIHKTQDGSNSRNQIQEGLGGLAMQHRFYHLSPEKVDF